MIDWDALVIGPAVAIFGEPVTYTAAGAQPVQITGVFDEAYKPLVPLDANFGDRSAHLGVADETVSEMPVLGVQLSQFATLPAQEDTLVARGQPYVVREVRLDGHGGAKLLLNVWSGW